MRFDILTLFPEMFAGPLTESILKRARQAGVIEFYLHNIRDYATDRHRTADDAPYGGGAGMVMKAEPLAAAIRAMLKQSSVHDEPPIVNLAPDPDPDLESHRVLQSSTMPSAYPPVVLMSPDGEVFTQALARELAQYERLVLVCGHYEGIDERVRLSLIDRDVSIGDYVMTGGELAAMVVVDTVARLVPGVLSSDSVVEESHANGLLEYPHYTRPAIWEGMSVPPVLLSGHHGEIAKFRRREALKRTLQRRPDMFVGAAEQGELTAADVEFLLQ